MNTKTRVLACALVALFVARAAGEGHTKSLPGLNCNADGSSVKRDRLIMARK